MKQRSRTVLRVILACAVVVSAAIGPLPLSPVIIALATLLAYEGPTRSTVYGSLATAFAAEVLFGVDRGVLSLAYLLTVLIFAGIRLIFWFTPWAQTSGWALPDIIRTWLVASACAATMVMASVMVGQAVYRYGNILVRLDMTSSPGAWFFLLGGCAIGSIILRRIDEPFRQPIRFGI